MGGHASKHATGGYPVVNNEGATSKNATPSPSLSSEGTSPRNDSNSSRRSKIIEDEGKVSQLILNAQQNPADANTVTPTNASYRRPLCDATQNVPVASPVQIKAPPRSQKKKSAGTPLPTPTRMMTRSRLAKTGDDAVSIVSVASSVQANAPPKSQKKKSARTVTATSESVNLMPPSSLEYSWEDLSNLFPWGRFLSSGASKKVYKVHNAMTKQIEAVSVMNVDKIGDKQTIIAELSVSKKLTSLARREICPNFITVLEDFSFPYPPAPTHWGSEKEKAPLGDEYISGKEYTKPRKPKKSHSGRYVYIRMEFCNRGDAEEFLKTQQHESVDVRVAQAIMFQAAFALYAAKDKFSLKHYDMKLLNIFLHAPETKRNLVLRYGFESQTFAVSMPPGHAYIAKIADYGTANTRPESNDQPVTAAQFTTLENTPPDYMILGDIAKQGHAHDCFGLGLCMLHLFTGHAPYEEILEEVKCPSGFKKRLKSIWENEHEKGYDVIRSVILGGDGEPNETLYDTLYRFLVLFGVPDEQFESNQCPKIWKAIHESFSPQPKKSGKQARGNQSDANIYRLHCKSFSIQNGSNEYIARARKGLTTMNGGMDLLLKLCSFDPSTRATAHEVLESSFMANVAEKEGSMYLPEDTVHSFTSFSTHNA